MAYVASPGSGTFTSRPRRSRRSTTASRPLCAATWSNVWPYGDVRACSLSGCPSRSVASLPTSPLRAASNSCPSTVSESTCRLSARQLEKPYCLARSNCASASRTSGFVRLRSRRRRLACLRSQSRLGASGRDDGDADSGVSAAITHLHSCEGASPSCPSSAARARNRSDATTTGAGLNPLRGRSAAPAARGRIVAGLGSQRSRRPNAEGSPRYPIRLSRPFRHVLGGLGLGVWYEESSLQVQDRGERHGQSRGPEV